ncbi:MAG: hypothetical protein GEU83_01775 [Pseudonocardiaceae bacterium]|nr:hypothetical protein [Pseudonocardiaceae bacterium]
MTATSGAATRSTRPARTARSGEQERIPIGGCCGAAHRAPAAGKPHRGDRNGPTHGLRPAGAASQRGRPGANGLLACESFRDGDAEVYTVQPDGSDVTRLTSAPSENRGTSWSPDGESITFNTNRDGGDFEIYSIRPDGSGTQRLTDSPGEDSGPVYSPDGDQIAFQSRTSHK